MDNDIVPALLEEIQKDFDERTYNSEKLKKSLKLLQDKKATYLDANDFAVEVGEVLSDVLQNKITAEILPDGKMHYNIANRILNPTMKNNYDLISNYAIDAQTNLNRNSNLRLKGQMPELNQDRIDGIVNRISSEDDFDQAAWLLDDVIVNFSQSVVDDAIKANAEFHAKSGLKPKITRRVVGHACDWCRNLAGTYDYVNAPDDIYRRHQRCRCTVDYDPGDGRKQDIWSKAWSNGKNNDKIEARKNNRKSSKDKIEYLNPIYNEKRLKKADYDDLDQWYEDREKRKKRMKKREEWLHQESNRFYNLRFKDVENAQDIVANIRKMGIAAEGLENLDPVALDSINRGLSQVNQKYPDFVRYLSENNMLFKAAKSKDPHELMAYVGNNAIEINTDHYLTKADVVNSIREFIDDNTEYAEHNFHAQSDEFTHIIVHELGHAFEDYLEYNKNNRLWVEIQNGFNAKYLDDLPFISEYASSSRTEWFAEIFGQSIVGKQTDSTKVFESIINKIMKG